MTLLEGRLDLRRACAWSSASSGAGLRHLAVEALEREAQHPVGQVAPGRDQLLVVAADELFPGEVDVGALGHAGGERVAPGIGRVALQHVAHDDHPAPALAELAALDVQVLVRRHVVGQVQVVAVADQHAGQMMVWKSMLSLPMK